jgi:signal transduction histidine kinase
VQISRVLKTTSFQLSLFYGAAFAAGFAFLLLVTYWSTTAILRDQIRLKVSGEIKTLVEEMSSDGLQSVAKDIQERMDVQGAGSQFYFLADRQGAKLAGNLDRVSVASGWQEIAHGAQIKDPADAAEDNQIWGLGTMLDDGSFLFAGEDAGSVLAMQETMISSFVMSAVIALFLAALVGAYVSRRFLGKIDAINRTSLAIIDGALTQRVPVRGTQDELDRLSANLNRLFDSNQTLLESLKHVTTNVAHDLRSPLSRLRQGLDKAAKSARNTSDWQMAVNGAIAEADQMLELFSALLRIAQLEAGAGRSRFKIVDLSAVFEKLANLYAPAIEEEQKSFESDVSRNVHMQGDEELLVQMFANILENAIRHTPQGTKIRLALARADKAFAAEISDTGLGIPAASRTKVFERFYRQEVSRTTPGNGLGLPLVLAIASMHALDVSLHDNMPGLKVIVKPKETAPAC